MASESKDAGTAEGNERVNYLALAKRRPFAFDTPDTVANWMYEADAALREAHGFKELADYRGEQLTRVEAEVERLRALLQRFYDDGYDRQACGAALGEKP